LINGVTALDNNYQIRSVPRMFEEVTRSIIEYIQEEELEQGKKLPPERSLSELLGVSRSSVREGLRILELLNYLESRQGGGTFVSEPNPFLIPIQLIKQNADSAELLKYFEIALGMAEKIIFLSMDKDSSISLEQHDNKEFWKEFSYWMSVLGKGLDNDYYLSLWNTIYKLLLDYGYFKRIPVDLELNELKISFYKKDKQLFYQFFQSLLDKAKE
jgi:GntR family transcriptional regulator, transcriptional repressor for pyruvate dehydrogenase complex